MANRLSASLFLLLGMLFMSIALLPVARVIVGIDATIQIAFFTLCMWLIAGLMAGLTGMILFARREAAIAVNAKHASPNKNLASQKTKLHACGLLLYTCLPFANFIVAYLLWAKYRHHSPELEIAGKEVINFQITIYVYLLLSLFLVFIAVGILSNFLLLGLHLVLTLCGIAQSLQNKDFRYFANINVVK